MLRRRRWQPTPVLLPGKSHGQRSLVGCSPWGHEESDTTERLHVHFSLSCIGEGNGNPLQCSCLESPRDGGAWWAAIYGVTQSWTRLKRLSSSSSSSSSYVMNILNRETIFLFCCGFFYFFIFWILEYFNWRIIALQNFVVFCQTSTWISCMADYVTEQQNSVKQLSFN